jgi:hydrogenase maturation factor
MVTRGECLTCGDVAFEGLVDEVFDDSAIVLVDGGRERVAIDLVAPVEPGDVLLCHAGIALHRVDAKAPAPGPTPPPWVGGPALPQAAPCDGQPGSSTRPVTRGQRDRADSAPIPPQERGR